MKTILVGVILLCASRVSLGDETTEVKLKYEPAPAGNPLKGLVPYAGDLRDRFPHSMEFSYLPLSQLMTGYNTFQWQPLEDLLNDIAGRGHQAVFRIWMEYPGIEEGIPKFLEDDGVKVTEWLFTETEPFPPSRIRTPDYSDPKVLRALRNFIAAMGKKYDRDPRIGFVTAGLLGAWGEWHNYPRTELMAKKDVQSAVMEAFESSFRTTPVLLRYPAGPNNFHYADNSSRRLGYHDDSFAWATLDTGKDEDNWYFMPSMKAAGKGAMTRWMTQPIGGEIRPDIWGRVFDKSADSSDGKTPESGQDFDKCVETTHATWMMDSGMFQKKQSQQRIRNATKSVQKMGYEFHIRSASLTRNSSSVQLKIEVRNTGVAPFYYEWPVEIAALDTDGESAVANSVQSTSWSLTKLLPGEVRTWTAKVPLKVDDRRSSELPIGIRAVNPLKNGVPLRFANEAERQLSGGWLRITAR